jgi:hypothetical protein
MRCSLFWSIALLAASFGVINGQNFLQGVLPNSNDTGTGRFAFSVATSGSLVFVGAPGKTIGSNSSQGAAYAFSCPTATSCTQASELTASNGVSQDYFGNSVAISDSLVVIGSWGRTFGSNVRQGSAFVFSCPTATSCTPGSELTASDGAYWDLFGNSVATSGSLVIIGAYERPSATSRNRGLRMCSRAPRRRRARRARN